MRALKESDDGFTLVEVLASIVLALMVTTMLTMTLVRGYEGVRDIDQRHDDSRDTQTFEAAAAAAYDRAVGVQAVGGANPAARTAIQVAVKAGDDCYTWVASSTEIELIWKVGVYPAGTVCTPDLPTTGSGIDWRAERTQDRPASFRLIGIAGDTVTGGDRSALDTAVHVEWTRSKSAEPGRGEVTAVRALPVSQPPSPSPTSGATTAP
jgi:prepilin-type N-terminal cleavage/methylation domain-containing protein